MTKITWADETWNTITGCSHASSGCKNCYAERLANRFGWTRHPWTQQYATHNITLHPERLDKPKKIKAPKKIFVNSMSDLFHEQIPMSYIKRVFDVMRQNQRHTFLVLTKRPHIMLEYCTLYQLAPLPNVWLGVSAENQQAANYRLPLLMKIPAAIRWVSVEPMLGAVDLSKWIDKLDWVVVGGESGREINDPNFRGMDIAWVRSIRDLCVATKTAFYFKQFAGLKPAYMPPALDGAVYAEYPQVAPQNEQMRLF